MIFWLCLGSNEQPHHRLAFARRQLSARFPDVRFSVEQITRPIGLTRQSPFHNQVACFNSSLTVAQVTHHLKHIEQLAGRRVEDKPLEIVRLDIDLLQAGTQVLKPHDMQRHYVIKGLEELQIMNDNNEKNRKTDMKFLGIIPARYASTRFPAKPLAMLGGKTVIQRVYEQVSGILDDAYVATDDERIEAAVKAIGGKVVMTSVHHKSGTDRCYEAACKIGGRFDVIVNIQGDEPFIQPSQLQAIKACFDDATTQIATLVKPFTPDNGYEALANANSPKVVLNSNMNALYFSRSIIPYTRNRDVNEWLSGHTYYKHIGLYAYRKEVLAQITSLPQSSLELAESLEQLRWLENGYTIKCGITHSETIGIDTPEDLQRAEAFLQANTLH